jgi:hypothetical protein
MYVTIYQIADADESDPDPMFEGHVESLARLTPVDDSVLHYLYDDREWEVYELRNAGEPAAIVYVNK